MENEKKVPEWCWYLTWGLMVLTILTNLAAILAS